MTPVTESDISRSAQTAWKAVFGRALTAAEPSAAPAVRPPLLVARVHILGAISGTLQVVCSVEEARRTAAGFYNKEASRVEEALVRDVFGELANMIGGLLKRHYPHSSRLSLPEVTEKSSDAGEGKTLAQVFFSCGAGPLAVRLLQNLS
jgi:hypothetical protein